MSKKIAEGGLAIALGCVAASCAKNESNRLVELGCDVVGLDERREAAANSIRDAHELNAAETGSVEDYLGIDETSPGNALNSEK